MRHTYTAAVVAGAVMCFGADRGLLTALALAQREMITGELIF